MKSMKIAFPGISRGADIVSKDGSLSRKSKRNNAGRLELWVQESDSSLEKFQRNSSEIERNLDKMSLLLQQLESVATLEVAKKIGALICCYCVGF